MRSGKVLPPLVLALAVAALTSACTTTDKTKVYQGEEFHGAGMYSHQFAGNAVATCEAARRALLSQGYVVADVKADTVNGQKSFQPDSDTHVEIGFHVVCVSDDAKGGTSTAFVNALQDRYAIKKTPSSASLGVGAVGAVSLPFGSSDDSLVKIASETIPPGPIYDRFFKLTGQYLAKIGADFGPEPTHEPAKIEVEPSKPVEHDSSKASDAGHEVPGPGKIQTPDSTAADKNGTTGAAAAPATPSATAPAAPVAVPSVAPIASPGLNPGAAATSGGGSTPTMAPDVTPGVTPTDVPASAPAGGERVSPGVTPSRGAGLIDA